MNMLNRNDSAFQRFEAPMVPLVNASAAGAGTAAGKFRVPVPDSRLRVKVSVIFIPAAGSTPVSDLSPAGATLWLYETEVDRSGVSGAYFPCANIEGTSAAPTAIPISAGLYGYSREFTTLADAIEGAFNTGTNGTQAGVWVMQATYSPDSVRFTAQEWNEITRQCNPARMTPVKSL